MTQRDKRVPTTKIALPIVAALISVFATIITAYLNFTGAAELPIRATQTAEALYTQFAPTKTSTARPLPITPSITPFPTPSLTPSATFSVSITNTPVSPNVETQVVALQNQVATLEAIVTKQASSNNTNQELKTLGTEQASLNERMAKIESVILDSTEKSLELTFMRKELDDLKISYKSDSERTLKEIERVYSQNNWFIGLMFSMAIGVISLAVGNFMKKPEKDDETKQFKSQPQKRSK